MSYYYKHQFISPQKIFARVKEELKSYFDSGMVDDTMFPLYVDDCLRKIGKSSYPINQAILYLDDYKSSLPEDFHAVREAWMCVAWSKDYQLPSAVYEQCVKDIATRVDVQDIYCQPCNECELPTIIEAVYKHTSTVLFQYNKQYLLTPGNVYPACPNDLYCANYGAASPSSYDIRDGKLASTSRDGTIYLQYYSNQTDDAENQLVPDTLRMMQFIEAYIKQKMFEQIFNQVTDETYNQCRDKWMMYKQMADEAFILADIDEKKQDVYRQIRSINRTRNRFRKFDIR